MSDQSIAQPTPGPWHRSAGTMILSDDDSGQSIAMLNVRRGEWEANAALIAAAPELLAACEMALADYDAEYDKAYFGNDGQRRIDMGARIKAVTAALTKARGQ